MEEKEKRNRRHKTIFRLSKDKIKEMDRFIKFLDGNQDITIENIIGEFGNMCRNTVYNYLKNLKKSSAIIKM